MASEEGVPGQTGRGSLSRHSYAPNYAETVEQTESLASSKTLS